MLLLLIRNQSFLWGLVYAHFLRGTFGFLKYWSFFFKRSHYNFPILSCVVKYLKERDVGSLIARAGCKERNMEIR